MFESSLNRGSIATKGFSISCPCFAKYVREEKLSFMFLNAIELHDRTSPR